MAVLGEPEDTHDSPTELCEEIFAARYGRFMACVPRTPNGKIGFMHKVSILFYTFQGTIIIVSSGLTETNFGHENIQVPPSCRINPTIQELSMLLGTQFNDDQRLRLSRLMTPAVMDPVSRLRFELYNLARAAPPPPPPLLEDNDDDEDTARLNEGIRLSMEELERANAKEKPPLALTDAYKAVLKLDEPPEPLRPGQPKCTVCLAAKATICFVNCGHLPACDQCVEKMWTHPDVAHACTVCRTPCTQIVRPHAPAVEEEAPKKPSRKKRKLKK